MALARPMSEYNKEEYAAWLHEVSVGLSSLNLKLMFDVDLRPMHGRWADDHSSSESHCMHCVGKWTL
jgi:hypothetical protein